MGPPGAVAELLRPGVEPIEAFEDEWAEDTFDSPDTFCRSWPSGTARSPACLLYRRPTGDLRVPEANVDLAHAATYPAVRGSGVGLALAAHVLGWAHEQGFRSITADWRSVNLLASASGRAAVAGDAPPAVPRDPVKVPLLAGTRVVLADAPDDATVLRPPAPGEALGDVGAAVRDALGSRSPGRRSADAVTKGGHATVVVESPPLPIPGAAFDPREEAVAAAVAELEAVGVPARNQTVLVAAGLARRPLGRELQALFSFDFARRFRGRVEVHDVEADDLVELGTDGNVPLRVHPALVETDLVLTVGAAESVLHGGLARSSPRPCGEALGRAGVLAPGDRRVARLAARGRARARARRPRPVLGVSLALNHPRLGALPDYPYDPGALERLVRSPLRALYGALPRALRERVLHSLRAELTAAAAFAGPPSVAHAEALLRAIEARAASCRAGSTRSSCRAGDDADAAARGAEPAPGRAPRARARAAALAGRLPGRRRRHRRLVNRFSAGSRTRRSRPIAGSSPPRAPAATRTSWRPAHAACRPARARGLPRRPRVPSAAPVRGVDACQPALARLGAVLVAECRDATAARQLGFVPVHSLTAALQMGHARAGDDASLGLLLSPPYFPLVVGQGT